MATGQYPVSRHFAINVDVCFFRGRVCMQATFYFSLFPWTIFLYFYCFTIYSPLNYLSPSRITWLKTYRHFFFNLSFIQTYVIVQKQVGIFINKWNNVLGLCFFFYSLVITCSWPMHPWKSQLGMVRCVFFFFLVGKHLIINTCWHNLPSLE